MKFSLFLRFLEKKIKPFWISSLFFNQVNNLLLINSVYYILVIVVFGLPMWAMTKITYRAPLPFDQIGEISAMKNLLVKVNFDLVFFDQDQDAARRALNADKLLTELNLSIISTSTEEISTSITWHLYACFWIGRFGAKLWIATRPES